MVTASAMLVLLVVSRKEVVSAPFLLAGHDEEAIGRHGASVFQAAVPVSKAIRPGKGNCFLDGSMVHI
jgi:hypothetical protein